MSEIKEHNVLTISRKWHQPKITTTISTIGITLTIDLEDFILAVLDEVGNSTLLLTKSKFEAKFRKAVDNVLLGIKEESAKVI